ncbi:MAG: dihydropteroate synthase [Candidatus Rokubacteria bacterium]|nr:dihydropteroate synthase [Candidatus Rokubacteria bacterium]
MTIEHQGLIVIGENLNATRKIKGSSPRILKEDGRRGLPYTDLSGTKRVLDLTAAFPEDPKEHANAMIPYVAQCFRDKDLRYLEWQVHSQLKAGAHIIDLCVDEMSPYPEERMEWIRWVVKAVQAMTGAILSIDSSDPLTIEAGLKVHDGKKSRPFINSVNLEEGRSVLHAVAKEHGAYLAGNASGRSGMPYSAQERVDNLVELSKQMDAHGIPMEDRFLDALVFPVGAGPEYGMHYLDAVRHLREMFPEVHLFGGHSNVSFGLPNRKVLNDAFIILSILAGCDTVMADPLMNPPREYLEFRLAAEALTGKDDYSMNYLAYHRSQQA